MPRFAKPLHNVALQGEVASEVREFQMGNPKRLHYGFSLAAMSDNNFMVEVNVVIPASLQLPTDRITRAAAITVAGRLSSYDGDWQLRAESFEVDPAAPRPANGQAAEPVAAPAGRSRG